MKLKVAFFFDINEIEVFCKNEVFDLTKYKNLNINFIHKKILDANLKKYSFNENEPLSRYRGVLYKQKNSLTVYRNNISDNWITNVELTAEKYNRKAVFINIDSESPNQGYQLYYYNGKIKRIIYSIKDGRTWTFFEKGPIQFFENGDNYSERGATKKFNYEKIRKYCLNLGIDIEDNDLLVPVDTVLFTDTL